MEEQGAGQAQWSLKAPFIQELQMLDSRWTLGWVQGSLGFFPHGHPGEKKGWDGSHTG